MKTEEMNLDYPMQLLLYIKVQGVPVLEEVIDEEPREMQGAKRKTLGAKSWGTESWGTACFSCSGKGELVWSQRLRRASW